MKKRSIPLVLFILIFSVGGLGFLLSQQSPEEAKFQKTMEAFLDAYWKFYPTSATLAGFYKYNDKLEDLSNKNLEKRHDELDLFSQELVAKIDKAKLGAETQIEYDILRNTLELELLRHESLVPWEYNPVFYNEIFFRGVQSLLTKEYAALDARVKSAGERIKQIPGLIKQAKENLKTPPLIYTETAIKQLPGVLDFYRSAIPTLIESAAAEAKTRLQADLAKAIAALEDYQGYLQSQLLPKSTGNFRLGEQTHVRLLTLTSEFSIPAADLVARAKADYNNIRNAMGLICLTYFKVMYPNVNADQLAAEKGTDQALNAVIQGVLDKLKLAHPTKEGFLEETKTRVSAIKDFLAQTQLIELPPTDPAIEIMPLALRGLSLTRLWAPGAYETNGTYVVQVAPLADEWSPEQVTAFLEEYNNFYFDFWAVRNVYPGLFVPTFFTRQHPSLVRKLFPNIPLLKGWSTRIEEMLIYAAFGNYDLRLRLNQLKNQLKAVIDFQLELNIHQGGETKERAVAYMIRGGFQTQAEAERKWDSILLNPGDAAYAYIGLQEIYDMEKDYKKLKGEAFNQKEFLQRLLSYGALPLRYLKLKMAE